MDSFLFVMHVVALGMSVDMAIGGDGRGVRLFGVVFAGLSLGLAVLQLVEICRG